MKISDRSGWVIVGSKSYAKFENFSQSLIDCSIAWNEIINEIVFISENNCSIEAMLQSFIREYSLDYQNQYLDFELENNDWKKGFDRIKKMLSTAERITTRKKTPKLVVFWNDPFKEKGDFIINKAIELANSQIFDIAVFTDQKSDLDVYAQALAIKDEFHRSVALLALSFNGEIIKNEIVEL